MGVRSHDNPTPQVSVEQVACNWSSVSYRDPMSLPSAPKKPQTGPTSLSMSNA